MVAGGRPKKFEKKKADKAAAASPKPKGKAGTKWDDGGHEGPLDYGGNQAAVVESDHDQSMASDLAKYASKSDVGKYRGDLQGIEIESEEEGGGEEEVEEVQPLKNISNGAPANGGGKKVVGGKVSGGIFSSLKSLVGAKVLSEEMIAPVMEKMQDHVIGNGNLNLYWGLLERFD